MTLDEFLALSWSATMRETLRSKAAAPEVQFLVAWDNAGRLSASAYTAQPEAWPETVVAVWCKAPPAEPRSKTQQAVDLVLRDGLAPFAAARQVGIHPSAVYRAMTRASEKPICPCCNQVVRDGFTVRPRAGETGGA